MIDINNRTFLIKIAKKYNNPVETTKKRSPQASYRIKSL